VKNAAELYKVISSFVNIRIEQPEGKYHSETVLTMDGSKSIKVQPEEM